MCKWKPKPDYWSQHDRTDGSERQRDAVCAEREEAGEVTVSSSVSGAESAALACAIDALKFVLKFDKLGAVSAGVVRDALRKAGCTGIEEKL